MDSYNRVKKEEYKLQITRDFINAEVSWRWQTNLFKEKGDTFDNPHPWEYYPHLYESEKEHSKEEQERTELERAKENRRRYAMEYKKRRG